MSNCNEKIKKKLIKQLFIKIIFLFNYTFPAPEEPKIAVHLPPGQKPDTSFKIYLSYNYLFYFIKTL